MSDNEPKTAELVPMRGPTAIVPHASPNRAWSLVPSSLGEAQAIAKMIAESDFAPKGYVGKPANVMIAIQMGADVGLKPMQALQNIAVINGRPSIWGDAALALVMPALDRFKEYFEGDGMEARAICLARRKGWPDETIREFSIQDAQRAGLWGKQGPWTSYPKRMLQLRARGFTLRDVAPDLLMGLVLAEEAEDYPEVQTSTVTVTHGYVEPVEAPFQKSWDSLTDEDRERIEKAFTELDKVGGFSPAQRHMKLNEFFGGDDKPAEAMEKLILWAKNEWTMRKKGRPMVEGNGKSSPAAPAVSSPPVSASGSAPAAGDQGKPSGAEGVSSPDTTTAPTKADHSQAASPFDANRPGKGELFRWVI